MGGNAFHSILPDASFPRMSPPDYQRLKERLTACLQRLYIGVGVPFEAPEKSDHGDLDFVVYGPREGLTSLELCEALGAQHSVHLEGNRMSNFAVPADDHEQHSETHVYRQVDVRVCGSKEEWEGILFFNSYGDLGMILGLVARGSQLAFGSNGLRLAKPVATSPPLTLYLSTSFRQSLSFFSLSFDKWQQGFSSQQEIFAWVATSPLFEVWNMTQKHNRRYAQKLGDREMYQNFLVYASELHRKDHLPPSLKSSCDVKAALSYFGKLELHTALLHVTEVKRHSKTVFNRTRIESWTNIKGPPVGVVMEEVRRKLGGNAVLATVCGVSRDATLDNNIDPIHLTLKAWESALAGMSDNQVRQLVLQAEQDLAEQGKLNVSWKDVKRLKGAQSA